jgi:hypothetical protein
VGRIEDQQLCLDLRSVAPSLDLLLVDAILQLGGGRNPAASAGTISSTGESAI